MKKIISIEARNAVFGSKELLAQLPLDRHTQMVVSCVSKTAKNAVKIQKREEYKNAVKDGVAYYTAPYFKDNIKEAVEVLKNNPNVNRVVFQGPYNEHIKEAVEALKKQRPDIDFSVY